MSVCVICSHDPIEPGRTTSTMSRGGSTVVVRGVPALVCPNCGEAYLEGDEVDRVLELSEAVFRSGAEIAVRDYEQKVAA